jgi:hypothetical protein
MRPAPNVVGGTPLQRIERKLIAHARLNAKGRGILQMMLLSSKQAFTMRLDVQARQLNASIAVVRALRRLAIQTGLFEKTPKGYERVKLADASFSARFRACEPIDLTVRLAATVLAMAHGSSDGWARPSINQLAVQLGARPERISVRVQILLSLGLFEVERQSGRRNAYRPTPLEEQQTSARRTIKKLKPSSSLTVNEVVGGAFNGSGVLADSFRSDVLARAMRLDLGGASEPAVAARLVDLYRAIRAARPGGATPEGVLGPLALVGRYVGWLEEQDWVRNATMRVIKFDSPAFSQFRREQARYQGYQCDPVTVGKGGPPAPLESERNLP